MQADVNLCKSSCIAAGRVPVSLGDEGGLDGADLGPAHRAQLVLPQQGVRALPAGAHVAAVQQDHLQGVK